jgi:uncharacterized protein (DUF1330 family)
MKYYACAEITVTRPDWIAGYVANVTKMMEAHGGRYLARTARVELMEGGQGEAAPQTVLLIEFESKEAAQRFYASADYAPYLRARQEGSVGRFLLVAGKDDFGVARQAG